MKWAPHAGQESKQHSKVRRGLHRCRAAAAQLASVRLMPTLHLTGPLQGPATRAPAHGPPPSPMLRSASNGCALVSIDLPLQDPFQGLRPERLPNGSWPWEVLEAEFGTARRFNEQVEEQVRADGGAALTRLPPHCDAAAADRPLRLLASVVMGRRVGMHAAAVWHVICCSPTDSSQTG